MDILGVCCIFFFGLFLSGGFLISAEKSIYFFVLLSVNFIVLRLYFPPYFFADYPNYKIITEQLLGTNIFDLGAFEFLSKIMFLFSSYLTSNGTYNIYPVYYFVFVVVLLMFIFTAKKYSLCHRNIILVTAVFSPLLLFVTLRASIPYVIVTILFLRRFKFDLVNVFLFVVAVSFHISSALILLPAIGYKIFENFTDGSLAKYVNIFVITFGVCLTINIFNINIGTIINNFALLEGSLDKYKIFFDASTISRSIFHQVFFVLIFIVGVWLSLADRECMNVDDLKKHLIFSSAFFVLSISPVVAFRFSIFFLIPSMLCVDYKKLLNLKSPLVQFACFLSIYFIFVVHFFYVLQPSYR